MTATDIRTCNMPACDRTVPPRSGLGRPREYCDDPKHTRVARLRAEQRARARAAKNATDTPAERPVTDRISALAAALDRLDTLKAELCAELADADDLAAAIADPDLLAAELTAIRADADARIAQALAAQAAAEHAAALDRRERDAALAERDAALELQDIAVAAAEEAIATRDEAAAAVTRVRADCDQQLARETAVADAELAALHHERDRIRAVADTALSELRDQRTELAAVRQAGERAHDRHIAELAAERAAHRALVTTLTAHLIASPTLRGRPTPRAVPPPAAHRRRTARAGHAA
ncbi:hypothetical protein [Nocardia sp. NPDC052566]|uniref:hypothetical protein n=1 Tax=Nocardia sp. NPDC052566 TaxID=3364330 RepID=UPI0037C5F501